MVDAWINCTKCGNRFGAFIHSCPKCGYEQQKLESAISRTVKVRIANPKKSLVITVVVIAFLAAMTIALSISFGISTGIITLEPRPTLSDLKEFALQKINEDRAKFDLQQVKLSQNNAAQVHAEDILKTEQISHWMTSGEKPYMTYTKYNGLG